MLVSSYFKYGNLVYGITLKSSVQQFLHNIAISSFINNITQTNFPICSWLLNHKMVMINLCHEDSSLCCHSTYSWQNIGRMNVLSVRWPAHSTNLEAAISRYVWIWYHVSLIPRPPLFSLFFGLCSVFTDSEVEKLNANWRTKNERGLGMRLVLCDTGECVMQSFLGLLLSFPWKELRIVHTSLCSKGCIVKLSFKSGYVIAK